MTLQSSVETDALSTILDSETPVSQAVSDLVFEVVHKRTGLPFGASLRRVLSVLALASVDAFSLLSGLMLAGYLTNGGDRVREIVYFVPLLLTLWLTIFAACDLYDRAQKRRSHGALLKALSWGIGLLIAGSILYPLGGFSLTEILLVILFIALLEMGLRSLYENRIEHAYQRRLGLTPTLIIGGESERMKVRRIMNENPNSIYVCVGELNFNGSGINLPLVRQTLDRTGARNIILAGTERISDVQFVEFLRSMSLRKVKVRVIPSVAALISGKPVISQDMGIPVLEVGYPRLNNSQWALKRMLDIAGSLAGFIFLSPLLIGVAILIKLTSPGPILFRQKRVGADEKVFTCYKFRSMYEDAERRQAELEARNEAGGVIFKIKNDPRITPIGRFIRRLSIDELPQLINVLKGEMSLVGPRPLPLRDFARMSELHKKRLATIPGITGHWQISGRSNLSFEDMVRLDLYYIDNWLLSLDIKIILKTLKVILRRDGAY